MTSLKQAMALLQSDPHASPPLETLVPSKLGTKEHWDQVYEREVKNFETIGDEGEVWFGEDSADDMVDWCLENCPPSAFSARSSTARYKILDVGCGNGDLSFRLHLAGYTNILGIDYSPSSILLSQAIARSKNFLPTDVEFRVGDLFRSDEVARVVAAAAKVAREGEDERMVVEEKEEEEGWVEDKYELILDKGTYDAISLSKEMIGNLSLKDLYPRTVANLLKTDGIFLITSCNWTKSELEKAFITPTTGLIYRSHIPRPSFKFGGEIGQTITTVAFTKKSSSSSSS